MSKLSPVEALMRYCERELTVALAEVMLEHTQMACEVTATEPTELPELLGKDVFAVLFMCVFEDFMTRSAAPGGVNVTDAFLKRHGWKYAAAARQELQAIRDSVMGLYEVAALRSDGSVEVRDVLLEGPPLEVLQSGLAEVFPVGALFAGRLVRLSDGLHMGDGMLPMDAAQREAAVTYLRAAANIGERAFAPSDVPALAPHITSFWLTATLGEPNEDADDDGEFEVIDQDEEASS